MIKTFETEKNEEKLRKQNEKAISYKLETYLSKFEETDKEHE